jgi:hypothetical protein
MFTSSGGSPLARCVFHQRRGARTSDPQREARHVVGVERRKPDLGERHVKLLGRQHRGSGFRAVADVGAVVIQRHRVAAVELKPVVDVRRRSDNSGASVPRVGVLEVGDSIGVPWHRGQEAHPGNKRRAALQKRLTRNFLLLKEILFHDVGHFTPAFRIAAPALWMAVMILG